MNDERPYIIIGGANADPRYTFVFNSAHTEEDRLLLAEMIQRLQSAEEQLATESALLDALDHEAVAREQTLAIIECVADDEPIWWAGIEWDGKNKPVREAIAAYVELVNKRKERHDH